MKQLKQSTIEAREKYHRDFEKAFSSIKKKIEGGKLPSKQKRHPEIADETEDLFVQQIMDETHLTERLVRLAIALARNGATFKAPTQYDGAFKAILKYYDKDHYDSMEYKDRYYAAIRAFNILKENSFISTLISMTKEGKRKTRSEL